ncbi:MAG: hypothetical protein RLZZ09_800 [Pseudomonadota bacterium]
MFSNYFPKGSEMSDVIAARAIIADTFDLSPGRRSVVIGLAINALKRVERALSPDTLRNRPRQWTERRVRSIVDGEARRIDAYEFDDLTQMRLAEARDDYRKSMARAERLAALLTAQDADFHGPEIDRLRQFAGGMDRARNRGASR